MILFPFDTIKTKRKTLSILITREGLVKVRAPLKLKDEQIWEFLKQKEKWVLKKLDEVKKRPKDQFFLLGRHLNLHFIAGEKNKVEEGEHELIINHKTLPKKVLESWVRKRAEEVFASRLEHCFGIFNEEYYFKIPTLKIRKMKARWGSLFASKIMTLNLNLIHSPLECIDYVIMHELCHLKFKGHGRKFYLLQQHFVPNWKELKKALEYYM